MMFVARSDYMSKLLIKVGQRSPWVVVVSVDKVYGLVAKLAVCASPYLICVRHHPEFCSLAILSLPVKGYMGAAI